MRHSSPFPKAKPNFWYRVENQIIRDVGSTYLRHISPLRLFEVPISDSLNREYRVEGPGSLSEIGSFRCWLKPKTLNAKPTANPKSETGHFAGTRTGRVRNLLELALCSTAYADRLKNCAAEPMQVSAKEDPGS